MESSQSYSFLANTFTEKSSFPIEEEGFSLGQQFSDSRIIRFKLWAKNVDLGASLQTY
jgi:hypothetical protein